MKSQTNSYQPDTPGNFSLDDGPRISGFLKKIAIALWGFITLLSLFSFIFSVYSLNLWDRLPAAELSRYFSDITPETVQFLAEWKNSVLQTGLSLSGYALIFTVSRVICAVTLYIVGFMLIRRYGDHLMAVLMAMLLSVFAATGMWNNPLFSWGVALAPWLNYPVQFLAWLTWCGAIVIYTFPDGKFMPRWTLWLAALLVPLTFLMAFNIDLPLNPNNWPEPFHLLPNILFTGAALFSIIHRHQNAQDVSQKRSLRFYAGGLSWLVVLYFIHLSMMSIYPMLTGNVLFESNEARLNHVLLSEPIWFASETFFAIGLALSVFRDTLMEGSAR